MKLFEKNAKALEFDKVLEKLAEFTSCEDARENALNLRPESSLAMAQALLNQTADAHMLLARFGGPSFGGLKNVNNALSRANAGSVLNTRELLDIAGVLRVIRTLSQWRESNAGVHSVLDPLFNALAPNKYLETAIFNAIVSEDEISDNASPTLADIRRKIRVQESKVREQLEKFTRSQSNSKFLQENIITQRNGRYVVPVKNEYRSEIAGLVHDTSSSGATVFIEPMAVVEANNEIRVLQAKEREEIERILYELSVQAGDFAQSIKNSYECALELNLIFAKAQYAYKIKAMPPILNDSGIINLRAARHPLIDPKKVVPVDIMLGKDFDTLVITGPNTGGKTVTLKTVGLFALMAQSGLFIPAQTGSRLPVFQAVYGDIGDEQSIEQSLSTFSSHMTNIVEILKQADAGSLVLLDELGAGTDPVEGAALAMSILEELHSRGCRTVATTHYSEIKAFALTRAGMENASMEFDVDRLCPTYRLFIGIPGKSNAFEISKRLGMEERLIEKAREYLKNEDVKFEDVISGAEAQRRRAEEERRLAAAERDATAKLREEMEKQRARLEGERETLRAKAREDSRRLVNETREEMEKLVAAIRAIPGLDQRAADRVIQRSRDALRKREADLAEPLEKKPQDPGAAPKQVRPGETVRILSLDQKATVLSPADAKGDVQVQAGIMKLTVKLKDLRLIQDTAPTKGVGKVQLDTQRQGGLELDVRGKLVDEAILEVDRYIDNCLMSGLDQVSIIHGKGTGALRAGIQDYLKRDKRVKSYRMGAYGEGDAGVTVVTLKK